MRSRRASFISLMALLPFFVSSIPTSAFANDMEVIAVAEPWSPYMGADLQDQGFIQELVKEVLGRGGYKVKTHFVPWARALKSVETGQADLLYGAFRTQERERFLKFSPPIAEVNNVLLSKKSKNISYKQLTDLRPYQIGVVAGAAHGKAFDEATFLNKDRVPDNAQNFKKLMMERVDLVAGPKEVMLYRIKNEFPQYIDQFEVLSPPLSTTEVHIGFSKAVERHQKLYDAFVNGLNQMTKDGSYARIAKKHGIDYRPSVAP